MSSENEAGSCERRREPNLDPGVAREPQPRVRDARELEVGRDDVLADAGLEPPRHLAERLGRVGDDRDVVGRRAQESRRSCAGDVADALLDLVVEPDRAAARDLAAEHLARVLHRQRLEPDTSPCSDRRPPPGPGSRCAVRGLRDRSRLGSVDLEPEHVGPVVVARGVEALPLLVEPRRIQLGVEDALLVVERPGEVGPVGAEDRRCRRGRPGRRRRRPPRAESRPDRPPPAGSGTARPRTHATRARGGRGSPATRRSRRRSTQRRSRRPTRRVRSARAACSSPSRSARRAGRAASRWRATPGRRPGPRSAARGW